VLDEVEDEDPSAVFFRWTLGISLLTLALFVSAGMGIYQEQLYKRYGKHPFEALYYTHLIPLPAFMLFGGNILDHLKIAVDSAPVSVPVLGFGVPIVLLYILGNMVTQYMCISSVYVLTTECQSLTVTLVVTLRKFVSLVFSILYFKNDFTIYHWVGTFCVFYGTIVFTEVVPNIRKSLQSRGKQVQQEATKKNKIK
jgi:UDP-xylose/UDP-N-acetylglucosamine transporter B4